MFKSDKLKKCVKILTKLLGTMKGHIDLFYVVVLFDFHLFVVEIDDVMYRKP